MKNCLVETSICLFPSLVGVLLVWPRKSGFNPKAIKNMRERVRGPVEVPSKNLPNLSKWNHI